MNGQGTLSVPELIQALEILGLDHSEAAIYVHLTQAGPTKASDVAATLRLRRPDVYRLLQRLVQRGFVTTVLGRPTRFQAAPPEQVFTEAFRQQEAAWERIAQAKPGVIATLESLRGQGEMPADRAAFKLLQGRMDALRTVERLIHEAQEEVLILSTGRILALETDDAANIFGLALRRAMEGLHVRAVLSAIPPPLLRPLPPSFELRVSSSGRTMRFFIADGRELVAWMVTDPAKRLNAEGDIVHCSTAEESIVRHRTLFEYVWNDAKPVSAEGAGPRARQEQLRRPPRAAGPGED
jgi:sugar-specific transcriptional regulator TrmB